MKKCCILFLIIIHCCVAQQNFTTYQAANLVVGQPNFTTTSQACTSSKLNWPSYSAISSKGVLAIVSQNGAGVRLWKTIYDANGKAADIVVGQNSFTSPNSVRKKYYCVGIQVPFEFMVLSNSVLSPRAQSRGLFYFDFAQPPKIIETKI